MNREIKGKKMEEKNSLLIKIGDLYNKMREADCKKAKEIYHYTSASVAMQIIENNKLRFTDRYYLNDSSEGRYVLQLCLDNIKKLDVDEEFRTYLEQELRERQKNIQVDDFYVHQISCSVEPDNLSLWNYYTKGDGIQGYNLGLDALQIEQNLLTEDDKKIEKSLVDIQGGKIIYDSNKQIEIINRKLEDFQKFYDEEIKVDNKNIRKRELEQEKQKIAMVAVDVLLIQGIFFKAEYFKAEQEYRIAIIIDRQKAESNGGETSCGKLRFMERNGIFIPYIDIKFKKDLLKNITISPTISYNREQESLKNMLETYQYCGCEIKESLIPVRY